MPTPLEYITTNNLPCLTWIDTTDLTKINTNASTFTILNKIGNSAYDFIQSNPLLHPSIGMDGIYFAGNERLSPRQADIFSPVLQYPSYSMIFVTRNTSTTEQQLLSISKNNPLLPKFLDIKQNQNKVNQSFSTLNLEDFLTFSPFNQEVQTFMFNHNIRLGKTDVSINKKPFVSHINTNKGYILNNFPSSFYLGNSVSSLPFIGELLHFLIFVPAISEAQMLDLVDLLNDKRASVEELSTNFKLYSNCLIDLSTNIDIDSSIVYTLPYVIDRFFNAIVLDLSIETSLSFYFTWNTLEEIDWNNIDNVYWDNLE